MPLTISGMHASPFLAVQPHKGDNTERDESSSYQHRQRHGHGARLPSPVLILSLPARPVNAGGSPSSRASLRVRTGRDWALALEAVIRLGTERRLDAVKTCLNAVTTGRPKELRAWVATAQAHGFEGVEFSAEELEQLVRAEGAEAALRLQAETGVDLAVFGLPVPWSGPEAAFRAALDRLPTLARVAAAAGCSRAATHVPPTVGPDVAPAAHALLIVSRLRACCEVLGEYGVRLALEWVGTPSLRTTRTPFLWTAQHIVALCEALGLPNAGLLLDSWHWHMTGGRAEDLELVPTTRIIHVHINDAPPNRTLEEQQDNVRLLPGQSGVIPLHALLSRLRTGRYDGYVAVETFSDLPKLGVDVAAARAREAVAAVW